MTKNRLRLIKILVPIAAGFLTLAAIEFSLAIFQPVPFSVGYRMYFEADPFTGYRLKPGGRGVWQKGIPAIANSHGHRDVETTLKKPPGVFRILAIGDSYTAGSNVRQEEAYPKVLERLLRKTYGPKIEIINSGVPGWGPFNYAQYFTRYGRAFEPDLILVGFFVGDDAESAINDVSQSASASRGYLTTASSAFDTKALLYDHSQIARLLMDQSHGEVISYNRKDCGEFTDFHLRVQKSTLPVHLADAPERREAELNAVNQIARIKAAAGNTPVVVALLPDENQINPKLQARILLPSEAGRYDFKMPQKLLTRMFSEKSLPTIDLLPAFLEDRRCLYLGEMHLTPQGQELAAHIIADGLAPRLQKAVAPQPRRDKAAPKD